MKANLTTKLVIGTSLVMLLSGAGIAVAEHTGVTKEGIVPGTIDITGVGSFGAAFCENVTGSSPIFCGTGGVGVFFDVSDVTGTSVISGTCTVTRASDPLSLGGPIVFACGNDRDDDSIVTNGDTSGGDATGVNGCTDKSQGVNDNDCTHDHDAGATETDFDDQFWVGTVATGSPSTTVNVCFAHDTDEPIFGGGHDFDDIVVFMGDSVGDTPYVGTAQATLSTSASGDCNPWSDGI